MESIQFCQTSRCEVFSSNDTQRFIKFGVGLSMQAAAALAAEVTAAGETEWPKTVASAKNEGKVAVFLYQRENIEAAVKGYRAHAKSSESGARRR